MEMIFIIIFDRQSWHDMNMVDLMNKVRIGPGCPNRKLVRDTRFRLPRVIKCFMFAHKSLSY